MQLHFGSKSAPTQHRKHDKATALLFTTVGIAGGAESRMLPV